MSGVTIPRARPLCLIVIGVVALQGIAGDINPLPGPVGDTYPTLGMKTLQQVEPRTPVQKLSGSAAALYVINQPGSYYLTGNVQGVPGKHGIHIASDDVTLDLCGFSVKGAGSGDFDGITMDQTPSVQRRNVIVMNGTVRGWGREGVNGVFGGANCIFRDLCVSDNGRNGLATNMASVSQCAAQNNISTGIIAYEGSSVTNCSATGNGQGYGGFFGATLNNCGAARNVIGMFISEGAIATNCIIGDNTGTGLGMGNHSVALNNDIHGNGNHGIEMFFNPSGPRIEGNTITGNTNVGINLSGGTNCIVLRNTARANGAGNYVTGASNAFGPIVNVAGVGDISLVPAASHPWANFSY